jgi:hypothetical protein
METIGAANAARYHPRCWPPTASFPSSPTPSIALPFDGWIPPEAGVAFVWVLERELAPPGVSAQPPGIIHTPS